MSGRRFVLAVVFTLVLAGGLVAQAGAVVLLEYPGSSPESAGMTAHSVQTATGARASASSGPVAHAAGMSLARAVGQLVVGTYAGQVPPASILRAVRRGHLGGVILMGDNTSGGLLSVRRATHKLQRAARKGGHAGLLIMTDQEGGEVKRLVGPPWYSASQMQRPARAHHQGVATGKLLRSVGINMDLAPVADVVRTDGFIAQEHRSFGRHPKAVAKAACAFAHGLASEGVAYTLKHFPGLGDAVASTDTQSVTITESNRRLRADAAPYRRCGAGTLASVMVSSASYLHLTRHTPAVLSGKIYHRILPGYGVTALTISDSFESGAISGLRTPARRSLNAGLDMVMYPGTEGASRYAYSVLLADARAGTLHRTRVRAAAARVLALKRALGIA